MVQICILTRRCFSMHNIYLNSHERYILQLFNLEDKDVLSISYNPVKDNDIAHVTVKLVNHPFPCPHCGWEKPKIKEYIEKHITHSLLNDRSCILIYKARRYICPVCHRTFYEDNPFSFRAKKISSLTVYNVLEALKDFNETFASVARRFYISPTSAASIFDAHVDISRKPLPAHLCIDEVYAFKSRESKYVCVLLDYKTQEVIDVLPSRRKPYLTDYFCSIPREEREKVQFVSYDMWDAYRDIARIFFPASMGCVDHYHIIQEMNRRLDRVRIRVMKSFRKGSDGYYLLKKFNWLLFKNDSKLFDPNAEKKYNHHFKIRMNYYDIYLKLRDVHPHLKAAWSLKDDIVNFYDTSAYKNAMENLMILIQKLYQCDIEELQSFGETLSKWKKEIVNSFIIVDYTYKVDKDTGEVVSKAKKMNNGIVENRNKIIKCVKNNANGYANWTRFRNRLLYVLNKDSTFRLYPKEREVKQS